MTAQTVETAPTPPPAAHDALLLSAEQGQAVVRLVEAAPDVRRRYQFFVWTQSQMQALVPHQVLVCGAYQRQRRALVLDAFHNIVLAPEVLQALTDPQSPLVAALVQCWVDGRGRPRALDLARLDAGAAEAAQGLRAGLGYSHLLVHGVARPQRPSEIESLFIFGGMGSGAVLAQRCTWLDLMLPHLHSTWQRVAATELELQRPAASAAPVPARLRDDAPPPPPRGSVTERERQILRWVREGKSNQAVAEILGISPLTVKNHIQKILRKLGAGNRAQAVAQALAQNLIDAATPPEQGVTPKNTAQP
jgi:transcriptional regulator EpsA